MPALQGSYFFGDWGGKVWTGMKSGSTLGSLALRSPELLQPGQTSLGTMVSFGEDNTGELYYVIWNSTNGGVYKIEPRTLQGPDCNANGRADACDLAMGVSLDANHNGVPDECDPHACIADFNGVGGVSIQDVFDFVGAWFAGCTAAGPGPCLNSADVDGSPGITVEDVFAYLAAWFAGC
jgi:hypothetical protein